ncbi:DUF1289 domain-containing protein [Sphingomonas sp.]|uniref:DUF1289 domain-containing protein n=1 Tax=Sphingomonas sp. TaxID=28214 RepID=UPI0035C7B118
MVHPTRWRRAADLLSAGVMTDDPPSPCTLVCTIDRPSGLCLGCQRTLDEIAGWSGASVDERHAILARVARRRAALTAAPPR